MNRVSPAILAQRFGSKRGLLLALASGAVEYVEACFDSIRAAHPSPLAALLAAATEMTRYTKTPEEMANHLAFLQIDLSDPDFYRLMLENSRRILAGYQALIGEAIEAGELVPVGGSLLGMMGLSKGKNIDEKLKGRAG